MSSQFDRCIFILIDGARPDALKKAVDRGLTPNLKKVFFEDGEFQEITTAFPSTTGPAYAPFVTGCFPGTCGLPGIRWFDRHKYTSGWNPRAVRSYVGIESYLANRDLHAEIPTLYELLSPSANIFSFLSRGVSFRGNRTKILRSLYWLYAHFTGDWSRCDRAAMRMMLTSLDRDPKYMFVVFPGVDEHSHLSEPFSERVASAYVDLDLAVGRLVKKLKAKGQYERTLIIGSSDHGLSQTGKHLELWKVVDGWGRRTLYHPNIFRRKIDAACMVSGNGMAHLYFQKDSGAWNIPFTQEEIAAKGWEKDLLEQDAVDQVISRSADGGIVVSSRKGQARLSEKNGRIFYHIVSADPFGLPPLPKEMSFDETLKLTSDTDYPDVLVQVVQLFRSPRVGDIIVTAKPGYDLRYRHEWPEHHSTHGSLHREHMLIPLLINQKLNLRRPARSADVFPTILELMGLPLPKGPMDGRSLLNTPC